MFNSLKKLIGNVTVRQDNGIIEVQGIAANVLNKDISKLWNTSKIAAHMFRHSDKSSFSFYSFFAPDVLYMINNLIYSTSNKKIFTNVKTLSKIKQGLLENTWLSKTQINDNSVDKVYDEKQLDKFYYKPLAHQLSFYDYYKSTVNKYGLKGALLNAAAGSGKTLTLMFLFEMLKLDTFIVVCPKNALDRVWKDTIENQYKQKQNYWMASSGLPYKGQRFIICHYEALDKLLAAIQNKNLGKVFIGLDESHNLNEITALRTNLFFKLCEITKSNDIIWASGTPLKALGKETIPLFSTIDPLFTEDAQNAFKKIFGANATVGLDILNHRLGFTSFIVEKKELQLQPAIIETIKVSVKNSNDFTLTTLSKEVKEFTEERLKHYKDLEPEIKSVFLNALDHYESLFKSNKNAMVELDRYKQCIILIRKTSPFEFHHIKPELVFCNAFEKEKIIPNLPQNQKAIFKDYKSAYKYVALKVRGECLGSIVGTKRIEATKALIDGIDFDGIINSTEKKTVVFTSYVQALEKCKLVLDKNGFNPLAVYGQTNNNLQNIIKEFEINEEVNPLIATFASLSTAVPLVMADTMIMLNSPFRDYVYTQAISRIHRLGATSQVRVFVAELDTGQEPNISSRSTDILKWSQEQISKILGIPPAFEINESLESEKITISTEGLEEPIELHLSRNKDFTSW